MQTSSIDRLQNKMNQLLDNSISNGSPRMQRLQNKMNNLHELEVDDYFKTINKQEIRITAKRREKKEIVNDIITIAEIKNEITNERRTNWKLVYATAIAVSSLLIILAIS